MKRLVILSIAGLALAIAGCSGGKDETSQSMNTGQGAPAGEAPNSAAQDWSTFVNNYLDDYFRANPDFAVSQGRHEFDGELPDWSAAGLANEIARLKDWRARAEAIDPSGLSAADAFERRYLIARIDNDLFWRETADWPHKNPAFYIGSLSPDVYISRPYADKETRMKAFIAFAKKIPAALDNVRANLDTPLPKPYLQFGVNAFNGFAEYFSQNVREAFAGVGDEAAQADLKAASSAAAAAFKSIADWMEAQKQTASDDFALGAEKFSAMLKQTEMVDTPLDQLEKIGRADLEKNTKALTEACAKFAPGATLKDCVAKEAADKPVDVVAVARKQLPMLKAFIENNDLVSIPGTEEAKVEEAPAYRRQNLAYINIPGPYEHGLPSVYYIAPPDPSWPPEKQKAYLPGKADLLFVSTHEVWPGHFLNFLHANRASSIFGRVFVGYAYAEGWAHYCEQMMWDAGLNDGDPETHIGQLLNALLRDVRFLSAIGLHTQGMTVAESEKMFLDDAFQDPGNAEQQALRGTYDPAYLNYTLGKLMIMKLREDWTASRGGRAAWKDFHDAFLSYGGPPIPLVRGAMMGEEPAAKF